MDTLQLINAGHKNSEISYYHLEGRDCPVIIYKGYFLYKNIFAKVEDFLEGGELQEDGSDDVLRSVLDGSKNFKVVEGYAENTLSCLANFAFYYCRDVENDAFLKTIIMSSDDAEWSFRYCHEVNNDIDMRNSLIKKEDPWWLYAYCDAVEDNLVMQDLIIKSEDPVSCLAYLNTIRSNQAMEKVVNKSDVAYTDQLLEGRA